MFLNVRCMCLGALQACVSVQDPDLVVEAMTSTSSSQSARASVRPPSATASNNARPHATASTTGTTAPPRGNSNSLRLDKQTLHFSVNAWVLVVAVLGVFPVVPRTLSNKSYRLSLLGTALSSFYSFTLYGKPRAWNLPSIQAWFESVIATKNFIQFIYCLVFVSSKLRFRFAFIPVLCWALEHVAKFLRQNFSRSSFYRKYLELPCVWVMFNTTALNILSSSVEIVLGFLLILSLFSWQRSILQIFMYWQLLKLMYHAPPTAGYHQVVWALINQIAVPYIHRYAPFLKAPLSAVQRWWLR